MAIYRLSADIVRRSAGRTATAAAAYRAGERIADQRTGLVFDYRRRSGVLHASIIAPPDAPAWMSDRATLWNGVEAVEKRKDAQLARDIELALPHELAPAARLDLVRSFVASAFVSQGMVADVVIHGPCRRDADKRNHHAHILLTMRSIEGDSFGPKVRAWNDTAKLEAWRASWADHVNRALEEAGETARVDHRSLEAQGIARVPQPKLGPAATAMETRGIVTDLGDWLRQVDAINAMLAVIEEAAPPPIVTLATPGRMLMRRRRDTGEGIRAVFRIAASALIACRTATRSAHAPQDVDSARRAFGPLDQRHHARHELLRLFNRLCRAVVGNFGVRPGFVVGNGFEIVGAP